MTRILLSILLATSSLSALSISISPKFGLGFITSGIVNPTGTTATIIGGYTGVNFSNWSIGVNTALYSSDQSNYGQFISGTIKYNINKIIIGAEYAYHDLTRASFVANCGDYNYGIHYNDNNTWFRCSSGLLSESTSGEIPNVYIGYRIPITDNFTLIPSYETTFPFSQHLSSFTIYLDWELFK